MRHDALLIWLVLAACQDDVTYTTATVTPADGGTVATTDDRWTITVPPGAVSEETEIGIRYLALEEIPEEMLYGAQYAGIVELVPEGLELAVPARVALTWTVEELLDFDFLPVMGLWSRTDDGTVPLEGGPAVDGTEFRVEADLERFGSMWSTPTNGVQFRLGQDDDTRKIEDFARFSFNVTTGFPTNLCTTAEIAADGVVSEDTAPPCADVDSDEEILPIYFQCVGPGTTDVTIGLRDSTSSAPMFTHRVSVTCTDWTLFGGARTVDQFFSSELFGGVPTRGYAFTAGSGMAGNHVTRHSWDGSVADVFLVPLVVDGIAARGPRFAACGEHVVPPSTVNAGCLKRDDDSTMWWTWSPPGVSDVTWGVDADSLVTVGSTSGADPALHVAAWGEPWPTLDFAFTMDGAGLDEGEAILANPAGGYSIFGSTSSAGAGGVDAWVLAIDGAGVLLSQRSIGDSGDQFTRAATPAEGGGWHVALQGYDDPPTTPYAALIHLDGNTDVVSAVAMRAAGYIDLADVAAHGDGAAFCGQGDFGAGSTMFAGAVDATGDLVWARTYSAATECLGIHSQPPPLGGQPDEARLLILGNGPGGQVGVVANDDGTVDGCDAGMGADVTEDLVVSVEDWDGAPTDLAPPVSASLTATVGGSISATPVGVHESCAP